MTDLVNLQSMLIVSTALFCIGLYGLLTRHNAVAILMSIELMLNAANINLVAFSRYVVPTMVERGIYLSPQTHQYATGQVFAIFVITLAAAEVAVGLAIIVAMYRHRHNINVDDISMLRW
jgi:NAD(P)H-quinone oxidoreductase subunit 4L